METSSNEGAGSVVIKTKVKSCSVCPLSSSNSALHDDPFTSAPLTTYYVCQAAGGPDFIWHEDAYAKIHPQCPYVAKEKQP